MTRATVATQLTAATVGTVVIIIRILYYMFSMLAPDFMARYKAQRAFEDRPDDRNRYRFVAGEYRNSFIVGRPAERGPHDLVGTELFIARRIHQLLQRDDGKPVVALDIGGGMGKTWMRQAMIFQGAVESGRLALAVTNLSSGSEQYAATSSRDGGGTLSSAATRARQNIHWFTTNCAHLSEQRVTLPDGRKLPLAQNVDLAHEKLSVTAWSKVPELDIPYIAATISNRGLYMVNGEDTMQLQPTTTQSAVGKARLAGIAAAHHLLQQENGFGLQRIDTMPSGPLAGEQMTYTLFSAAAS